MSCLVKLKLQLQQYFPEHIVELFTNLGEESACDVLEHLEQSPLFMQIDFAHKYYTLMAQLLEKGFQLEKILKLLDRLEEKEFTWSADEIERKYNRSLKSSYDIS